MLCCCDPTSDDVFVVPSGRFIVATRKGAEHASNILGALEHASRPLSAYDLLDKLRPTGVSAPLTIYRALDKLIASGKVHRSESLNAFVACRNGEHHGHGAAPTRSAVAFAICDHCGHVDEFLDAEVFGRLDESLGRRGFQVRSSAIEVRGLCAACVEAADRDRSGRHQ